MSALSLLGCESDDISSPRLVTKEHSKSYSGFARAIIRWKCGCRYCTDGIIQSTGYANNDMYRTRKKPHRMSVWSVSNKGALYRGI